MPISASMRVATRISAATLDDTRNPVVDSPHGGLTSRWIPPELSRSTHKSLISQELRQQLPIMAAWSTRAVPDDPPAWSRSLPSYRMAATVIMVHCSACKGWGRSTGGGSTVRLPSTARVAHPGTSPGRHRGDIGRTGIGLELLPLAHCGVSLAKTPARVVSGWEGVGGW